MKVTCSSCSYSREKPKLEHLIYVVKKDKGSIINNICPACKGNIRLEEQEEGEGCETNR